MNVCECEIKGTNVEKVLERVGENCMLYEVLDPSFHFVHHARQRLSASASPVCFSKHYGIAAPFSLVCVSDYSCYFCQARKSATSL